MYAGRVVEAGTIDDVIDRPRHPYTVGLLGSVPSANKRGQRLNQIPGMAPNLLRLPPGCAFKDRCPRGDDLCLTEPTLQSQPNGRAFRCHHPHEPEGAA